MATGLLLLLCCAFADAFADAFACTAQTAQHSISNEHWLRALLMQLAKQEEGELDELCFPPLIY